MNDHGFLVLLLLRILEVHGLGLLLRVLLDLDVDRLGGRLHLDLPGEHLVDAGLEVGQDALEFLLAELLEALLQLFARFLELLVGLREIVGGVRPLVRVQGAGRVLFIRDGLAHALSARRLGLRLIRLRGAGLAARRLRLAGRGPVARRALALARRLIALRRRALLVALVVLLVAGLHRLVRGLVARLLHRLGIAVARLALGALPAVGRRALRTAALGAIGLPRVVLVAVVASAALRVFGLLLELALRVFPLLWLALACALRLVVFGRAGLGCSHLVRQVAHLAGELALILRQLLRVAAAGIGSRLVDVG